MKKIFSEYLGTAILVLIGCGTVAVAGSIIKATGIAFVFGLTFIAIAYMIGKISGCHINPAVSLAMAINKKITWGEFIYYVVAQVLGALSGIAILYFIVKECHLDINLVGLGQNGFGEQSSVGISMIGALVTEIILTFIFILTILTVTSEKNKVTIPEIVIGLTLTAVHIIGVPITGTGVNPARSLAPAVFLGGEALSQVWVFIVAPFIGSILASIVYKFFNSEDEKKVAKKTK